MGGSTRIDPRALTALQGMVHTGVMPPTIGMPGQAAGPPSARPMLRQPMPPMPPGIMRRKSGGRVSAKEAKRRKAIADALSLIAQSPEFGALLRGAEGKDAQHKPGRR